MQFGGPSQCLAFRQTLPQQLFPSLDSSILRLKTQREFPSEMGVWLKMDLWSDKLHCFLKPSLSYPTKPVDSEVLCPHSDASGGDWNAIRIQTWGSNHFETYPFWNLPGTTKVEQLLKLGHPETCVMHGHSCMTKHSALSPKMDASTPTTVISSVVFRTSKWVCQYILSTKMFMLLVPVASPNFHDPTGEQQLPWPLSVGTGCTRPVSSCWWHGTFESFPQKPSPLPWRSLGTYPILRGGWATKNI